MPDPEIVVRGRYDGGAIDTGLTRSASKLNSFAKTAGKVAALGLLAAGAAAVKFGVESVKAASDAQQSIGATQTVFGKYADTVIKRSKQAADAVGLSANEYRELSNSTGAMLAGSGMDLSKVADLTGQLNERAADVSATFGGSAREAVEAFGSALRGETDPIERYGVSIKATDVSARLAAQGQDKLTGAALKQAEQLARLDLIFEQTSKSQGAFGRESDTLAGQQQRLAAKVEDLQAKVGKMLLPVLTQLAEYASSTIIPKLEEFAEWVKVNQDEIAAFAGTVKDTVLPPLKTAVDVLGALVGFLVDLPAPVQQFGIAAAGAALAWPKINTAVSAFTGQTPGLIANLRNAETRTAALGRAARAAAGVGGLGLLVAGAANAESSLGKISSIAGAGLTGFAVAGPWGAALAAGATALTVFSDAGHDTIDMEKALALSIQDVIQTLDEQTGAFTRATRATVSKKLEDAGLLKMAQDIGIPLASVTKATLQGREAIFAWRTEALAMTSDAQERTNIVALANEMQGLNEELFEGQSAWARNREAMGQTGAQAQAAREQIRSLSERMNLVPKDLRTIVRTVNADQSAATIRKLQQQYNLTPTELKTIVATLGTEQASRKLLKVRDDAKAVDEVRPKMQPWLSALSAALSEGGRIARTGSLAVGNSLEEGVMTGVSGLASRLHPFLAGVVSNAIAAAKAAADAHSPSRKMVALGHDLGDGLILGVAQRRARAERAGVDLVENVMRGALSGSAGVAQAIELITKTIERQVKMKDSKAEERREKEILASLRERIAELRGVGQAQDRLNEKLKTERDELKALREQRAQYAATVADGIRTYSALSGLISSEEGALNDAPSLLDRLRQKLGDTQEFARLLGSLRGGGLNEALVQQIEQAGVEGGLALAQAISAGGPAAIAEFSTIQDEIDKVSATIGANSAAAMYDAGIAMQQGLVAGLEADSAKLAAYARKLARILVKALKDELGIKSPSKVMEDVGVNMMRGLQLGLADTHARRLGTVTADALVQGFGTPTLTTRVPLSSGSGGAAGGNTYKITVVAPVGSSKAEIGGEVVSLIKAYEKAGGRELANG